MKLLGLHDPVSSHSALFSISIMFLISRQGPLSKKKSMRLLLSVYEGMGGWSCGILFAGDIVLAAGGKRNVCLRERTVDG